MSDTPQPPDPTTVTIEEIDETFVRVTTRNGQVKDNLIAIVFSEAEMARVSAVRDTVRQEIFSKPTDLPAE